MEDNQPTQGLRCRPGDLARVIYSTNALLIGRVVFVEGWGANGRWNVTLLGDPAFGIQRRTGRPIISNKTTFRDSSLQPLNSPRPWDADSIGIVAVRV